MFLFNSTLYAGSLTFVIDALKSNKGYALFSDSNSKSFPSENLYSFDKKSIRIIKKRVHVIFNSLLSGVYALAVYQDKDRDGKLDRSIFGRSKEPYGFSNNPDRPRRGPVSFEKASFNFEKKRIKDNKNRGKKVSNLRFTIHA